MVEKIRLNGRTIANYMAAVSVILLFAIFFINMQIVEALYFSGLDDFGNSFVKVVRFLYYFSIIGVIVSIIAMGVWAVLIKKNKADKYLLRFSYALLIITGSFFLSVISFPLVMLLMNYPISEALKFIE